MAFANVIGRCKRHDAIDAILLFEHTLWINSLFACKCDCLDNFFNKQYREMNVNISNEFDFSDVHGAMNHCGSLAKLTQTPLGFIHFAHDPLWFIAP